MNDNDKIQITGESKPDKVKALAENIIAECKQQGFKIHDFKYLQELLNIALAARIDLLEIELF